MYQAIVRTLRGDYNSVRYRFLTLPKEWAHYMLHYRLRGKDWTDFYTHRMNREAELGRGKRPSEQYLARAEEHLAHLKAQGMQPHHRMLDYGCGVMRTGRAAIPYLSEGRYVGVDIAENRLQKGRDLLAEDGISADRYEAFTVADCELKELDGYSFDYIWAESVLTHMPAPEIRTMLRSMKRLFAPGGQFLFTFSTAEEYKRRNVKDFWYPHDFMEQECRAAGYQYALVESGTNGYTRMARLTLPDRASA